MPTPARLDDALFFLVHQAPGSLGITQVMKLLFLADVEHVRLYGEPMTGIDWTWHNYGPFSPAVYHAVEALDEQGRLHAELVIDGRHSVRSGASPEAAAEPVLPPQAERALTRVLHRYGSLPLAALKRAAYETETMRQSAPGHRLDLSREPRRSLAGVVPGLAALLQRTPLPEAVERGDPDASAAEDLAIMDDLAALRREANRELR